MVHTDDPLCAYLPSEGGRVRLHVNILHVGVKMTGYSPSQIDC